MRGSSGKKKDRVERARKAQSGGRSSAFGSSCVELLEQRQLLSATIVTHAGPLMASNGMLTYVNQAASYVQSLFDDNITIHVDVERSASLGSAPAVVSVQQFNMDYDTVRDLMVADRAQDEAVVDLLPTASQVSFTADSALTVGTNIHAARANLLALGVSGSSLDSAPSAYAAGVNDIDFTILFNTGLSWDYNRADGINPGQLDFFAVATQAMFKGLGFTSEVDAANGMSSGTINPTTLDLFRVAPGTAATDFTNTARILAPGVSSVFYDGGVFDPSTIGMTGYASGEVAMSTGTGTGGGRDGNSAASWKDDAITGKVLGTMDPTFIQTNVTNLLSTDLRAMGLIGYNLANGSSLTPGGALTVTGTAGNDTINTALQSGNIVITYNGNVTRFTNAAVSTLAFYGGDGNDTINLGTVTKGATMSGGAGNDTLTGGSGNDTFYGDDGDDFLRGKTGRDIFNGGLGIDTVSYDDKTAGVVVTFDGLANDGNTGEQDNVGDDVDVIIGTAYADTLDATGKSGGVTLYGRAGNDTLKGSLFSDSLYGEDGNDTIYTRDGVGDLVDGGIGTDAVQLDLLFDTFSLIETLLP